MACIGTISSLVSSWCALSFFDGVRWAVVARCAFSTRHLVFWVRNNCTFSTVVTCIADLVSALDDLVRQTILVTVVATRALEALSVISVSARVRVGSIGAWGR